MTSFAKFVGKGGNYSTEGISLVKRNFLCFSSKWHLCNPLTTDDECTRHATLAARYQLVQSVLKIGFALAKKVG